MNELALVSGCGGGILGGKLVGWNTVCAVEWDPYAISVLIQRQNDGILPPFPIWDDICNFDGRPWKTVVDVVSAGFPCPAFSTATHGNNIREKDLWHEVLRVVSEVEPTFFFGENVSREAIIKAAADLNDLGYACKGVKLSASDVGADHVRTRYWILAYPDNKSELLRTVHAEMGMLPELSPRVWEAFPGGSGMDDGIPNRVDRFRVIGNGQIPVVAALAWKILIGEANP